MLLAVIAGTSSYGYQIVLEIERRTEGRLQVKENALYPALHRLERNGFLEAEWQTEGGRRRRYYRLTERGRQRTGAPAGPLAGVRRQHGGRAGGGLRWNRLRNSSAPSKPNFTARPSAAKKSSKSWRSMPKIASRRSIRAGHSRLIAQQMVRRELGTSELLALKLSRANGWSITSFVLRQVWAFGLVCVVFFAGLSALDLMHDAVHDPKLIPIELGLGRLRLLLCRRRARARLGGGVH